jgi:phospholipid-binding lipoprotein MlaA
MKYVARVCVILLTLALAGCASTNPKDPFEDFNRAMFSFNDAVDEAALKPAAEAYSEMPTFIQTGVSNFFGNLGDVWTAVNNLLQGKFADGMSDVMRVAFNSTFGLGGLLDIGSEAGLVKHREDFGQTLGVWGVGSGPYVVLPLLGSSTLRDTAALPVDFQGDAWAYVTPVDVRNVGSVVRVVDQRAALLGASSLIEEAALDRYVFIRDAYMQRQESKIRDGESPRTSYEGEEYVASTSSSDDAASQDQQHAEKTRLAEPGSASVVESEQVPSGASQAAAAPEKKQ